MAGAILIYLALPILDRGIVRSNQFRILSQLMFWIFVCNFIGLGHIGELHVEAPFITLGQVLTAYYFAHFLIIIPLITSFENVLFELSHEYNE